MSRQTNDRNYLRMLDDWELVDHAQDAQTPTELEIVLAERLKAALRKLEDGYYEDRFGHYVHDNASG